jgi:4-hydroxy-3-polyprenylbenzoate decarboxylase
MMAEYVIGVTGASGAVCAQDLILAMASLPAVKRLHVVMSRFAAQTIRTELKVDGTGEADLRRALAGDPSPRVVFHSPDNMAAPISSGTYPIRGMVVIPCSAGTLGAIASGATANLIHRAADVTLKERRPLILAVRETPLNGIHLRNLLALSDAGAVVFPLTPSFYTLPADVKSIVEQFTARILDLLGLEHSLGKRWGA